MKTSRLFRLTVAFLFIAAMILPVGQGALAAPSSQTVQAGQVVGVIVSAASQAAAQALWTPAAMAAAKPLPMPVDTGTFVGRTQATAAPSAAAGKPGFAAPGNADPNADSAAQKAYPADWQALASSVSALGAFPSITDGGTANVFTSYIVNQWSAAQKIYPNKQVGRLYISGTPGSGYCSATAIDHNMIVTAAHCVYDLGAHAYFSNWVFSPAYRAGSAPYGTFKAASCWVLNTWTGQGSYSISGATPWDVAVCVMNKNSAKKTLNSAVGWAGRMWDWTYDWDFHDLGYPWEDTNSNSLTDAGKYLRLCTAEGFQPYSSVIGMGCNWGPGISGGPWMVGYAPNVNGGYIDSVNSGYYPGYADMYGIQFSAGNIGIICAYLGCYH